MEEITKLNVRVYGLLFKEEKLLFLKEMYGGRELFKFPGGGLELGESTMETLKREFLEELNLKIKIKEHFYTQDFFIKSKLTPNDQLLSIYYLVDFDGAEEIIIQEDKIVEMLWVSKKELGDLRNLLPVDEVVVKKIIQMYFLF